MFIQLLQKLSVADVLSQRRRQSVQNSWSSDAEVFVANAGVYPPESA